MNPVTPGLFDDVPGARNADPETSHLAHEATKPRVGGARAWLLLAYADRAHWGGLIDEEAAMLAGLSPRSCWWKRCSELRALGLIEPTGTTGTSSVGQQAQKCAITRAGMAVAAELKAGR